VAYSSYDTVLKSIGVFEENTTDDSETDEGETEEDETEEDETEEVETEEDETIKTVEPEDEAEKTRRMAVNWLQTPHDAMAYWTREVGFEN
jgi:Ser-tRNA(Ala) deacylase AlaX